MSIYHFIAKCLFVSFLYFYLFVCLSEECFHGQESHLPRSVNDMFTCVESQVNVFVYKTRSKWFGLRSRRTEMNGRRRVWEGLTWAQHL